MRDSALDLEARIDRVLRGLREAEPADGLEVRVLRAVVEERSAKTEARRNPFWLVLVRATQSYAVATTVLVLVFVLGWANVRHRDQQVVRHGAVYRAKREQVRGLTAPSPAPIATAQPMAQPPRAARPERRAKLALRRREHADPAFVALQNHPAPEQPLTDEERLLLHLAHRAGPDEFDVLNPDARDAQAKSDKAEFRNFFGPPPTGDSE